MMLQSLVSCAVKEHWKVFELVFRGAALISPVLSRRQTGGLNKDVSGV